MAASNPRLAIDGPVNGSEVIVPFLVGGWAIDLGTLGGSGTGVNAVHVYAFPAVGAGIFLGAASYGGARTDVAAIYGAQYLNSGFTLTVNPLAVGPYQIQVFPFSTVVSAFTDASVVNAVVTVALPDPVVIPAPLRQWKLARFDVRPRQEQTS